MPYSGPVYAYGVQGQMQTAYFRMISEEGRINGRKLRLISLADARKVLGAVRRPDVAGVRLCHGRAACARP
jgi:hypothetical protein